MEGQIIHVNACKELPQRHELATGTYLHVHVRHCIGSPSRVSTRDDLHVLASQVDCTRGAPSH